MEVQWLGHACFRLAAEGYAVVIDPYADGMVPGLRPLSLEADEVLTSHDHSDHGYVEAVRLTGRGKTSPFTVTRVESDHDDCGGAKRGKNIIHVLEAGGVRVAHLGDLGCPLTQAQLEAIGPLDAVMIPVGGYYTIDAKTARAVVGALAPRVVIPMHYRSDTFGFALLDTIEAYLSLCGDARRFGGDTIQITKDTPGQTAVLQYQ